MVEVALRHSFLILLAMVAFLTGARGLAAKELQGRLFLGKGLELYLQEDESIPFFVVSFLCYDWQPKVQRRVIGGLFAVDALMMIVFVGILGWI